MGTRILRVTAILGLAAAAAGAQSVVTELVPGDAVVEVERLSFDEGEPLAVGDALDPGDLVESLAPGVLVELNCPPESSNFVTLEAPFRVLVDVAEGTACHIDLLAGSAEVLAEEPTEITSGGVQMTSVGTQYAVRLDRVDGAPEQQVLVFEGEVEVASAEGRKRIAKGQLQAYRSRQAVAAPRAIPTAELLRSASVYTNLDLAKAERAGVAVPDKLAAYRRLQALHVEVLEKPDDQPKRVELAQAQMLYQSNNRALYHLKKADVAEPEKAKAYQIDLSALRGGLTAKNRAYVDGAVAQQLGAQQSDQKLVLTHQSTAVVRQAAADRALQLLSKGEAKEAVDLVHGHLKETGGRAGSRDYLVLALGYDKLGSAKRAVYYAKEALDLDGADGDLSDRERIALKRLLERLG